MSVGQITAHECNRLRRDRENGRPFARLVETRSASRSTISYHLTGQCTHDVAPLDTDAVADAPSPCERAVRQTLDKRGASTCAELAEATEYSSSRIGDALRELRSEGVIDRRPCLSDPRTWVYSLTTDDAPEAIPK